MRGNDELFREIAEKYISQYGQSLRDEKLTLDRQPEALPSTDSMERRVRGQIASAARRPYLRIAAALAACLVIVFLLPLALRTGLFSPDSATDPNPTHSDATDFSVSSPQNFVVIPLSAPLPSGFTKSGFEMDNGKSVYYVEDVYRDNVVITLEKAALPNTSGLTAIKLGDTVAYGTQTDSYSLLTFQRGAVVYELTCRYDINTLLQLGEAFV